MRIRREIFPRAGNREAPHGWKGAANGMGKTDARAAGRGNALFKRAGSFARIAGVSGFKRGVFDYSQQGWYRGHAPSLPVWKERSFLFLKRQKKAVRIKPPLADKNEEEQKWQF